MCTDAAMQTKKPGTYFYPVILISVSVGKDTDVWL